MVVFYGGAGLGAVAGAVLSIDALNETEMLLLPCAGILM
jgi:hypothetical protein